MPAADPWANGSVLPTVATTPRTKPSLLDRRFQIGMESTKLDLEERRLSLSAGALSQPLFNLSGTVGPSAVIITLEAEPSVVTIIPEVESGGVGKATSSFGASNEVNSPEPGRVGLHQPTKQSQRTARNRLCESGTHVVSVPITAVATKPSCDTTDVRRFYHTWAMQVIAEVVDKVKAVLHSELTPLPVPLEAIELICKVT
ncbi:hypothetical protein NDU88_007128 [Pleurodeles waltl]|uniref:Uncharacterized protein n=1 Tax=Pleurodeles waltl TaxID=8319 RepID=A0AAV7N2W3_PLEWA|nr:hypothetical protein NDU88_007128 [Pleurodeles waltl]